ncbi:MAG: cell division protein ZapA [Gammaproteobacteria bacterium]|nr:cell division protein ZapA [Gammaproteobacteria bacterium]
MSENPVAVNIHILGKEYRIACSSEEQEGLLTASRLLDSKMREIRDSGKVIGGDRIAVMTALNLAHELMEQQNTKSDRSEAIGKRLRNMHEKIDIAINQGNQLEL